MIIQIMDGTKSLSALAADQTNGLGRLPEAYNVKVTEERNGVYELEFTVPMSAEHFGDLQSGSIIRAKVSDGSMQLFEVYQMDKAMNGITNVDCHHISYRLNKAPVSPFTANGAAATASGLVSHLMASYPFTMWTDITNASSTFTLDIPRTFRECLGGYSGSVLDVFGGEYEWDNLTVKLHAHRGADHGVRIAYGKNLTDLKQEANIEAVYDAVLGYATVSDTTYQGSIVYANGTVAVPKVKIVDFSDQFDSDEAPTAAALDALSASYINANSIGTPKVNLEVGMAALWQDPEYADLAVLESVKLCDTVHVEFPKLGVSATAKVIGTEWDVVNERYVNLELGDARTTLAQSILNQAEDQTAEVTGFIDEYVSSLTSIISNSLGLFITKEQKAGGGVQIYLHNAPTLAGSQYQWTINAGGFAVSQDYGQTWSAGFDSQGNAVFNSLAANVVKAMNISGGRVASDADVHGGYVELVSGVFGVYDTNGTLVAQLTASYPDGVNGEGRVQLIDNANSRTAWLTATELRIPNYDGTVDPMAVLVYPDNNDKTTIVLNDDYGHTLTMSSGFMSMSDDNGTRITISDTDGLSIYINGTGQSGLSFITMNGHQVLGK